jgi:hypothetical protein
MDYIIVGAGPSGLTTAWLLAKQGKKCTIVDTNISIGGCHRVLRTPNTSGENRATFSEHGPRIYSGAYKSLQNLLKDMGGCFDDFFTPYDFSISTIGGESIKNFTWKEMWTLFKTFLVLGYNPAELHNISMLQFMHKNNFSNQALDYIDRLCRLTNGAGSDRYSLYQFLQLINQQAMYGVYQPKCPNDEGLFAFWKSKLDQCGVKFLMGTKVRKILVSKGQVIGLSTFSDTTISAKSVILAVPPVEMYEILSVSGISDTFGFDNSWATATNYIPYQNISFYWKNDVLANVPRVHGFTKSEWGIVFIVLSDYFNDSNNPQIKSTLISVCTTIPENYQQQNLTQSDFINSVFEQLKKSYPNLPLYDNAIMNIETDTAYLAAAGTGTISHQGNIKNLYNVGTHNGNNYYAFTSMESAISNAIHLVDEIEENNNCAHLSEPAITLWQVIILFLLVCILASLLVYPLYIKDLALKNVLLD